MLCVLRDQCVLGIRNKSQSQNKITPSKQTEPERLPRHMPSIRNESMKAQVEDVGATSEREKREKVMDLNVLPVPQDTTIAWRNRKCCHEPK